MENARICWSLHQWPFVTLQAANSCMVSNLLTAAVYVLLQKSRALYPIVHGLHNRDLTGFFFFPFFVFIYIAWMVITN